MCYVDYYVNLEVIYIKKEEKKRVRREIRWKEKPLTDQVTYL